MSTSQHQAQEVEKLGLGADGKGGVWINSSGSRPTALNSPGRKGKKKRLWLAMPLLLAVSIPAVLFATLPDSKQQEDRDDSDDSTAVISPSAPLPDFTPYPGRAPSNSGNAAGSHSAPKPTARPALATKTDAKTKAVQAWVAITTTGPENARTLIERETKFPFAGMINSYDRLSDEQQFQVLLEAAALGGGPESEKAVLALMSKALAQRYDAAKGHPHLRVFHGYDAETKTFRPVDCTKIKFALPERLRSPDLEPGIQAQVRILAHTIESSPTGGPLEYLKYNFNLPGDEVAGLMVRSGSFNDVLGHVLAKRPRNEQELWIARAYRDLSAKHEALRGHPAFQMYHLRPTIPSEAFLHMPRPYGGYHLTPPSFNYHPIPPSFKVAGPRTWHMPKWLR